MKKNYFLVLAILTTSLQMTFAQIWIPHVPNFGDTVGIADIHVVNENVVWAVGLRYAVDDSLYGYFVETEVYAAVTSDGGATWSVHTVPFGNLPFVANMSALDANTAYVAGLNGTGNAKVLKTSDGGATWQTNLSPPYDNVASWPDYIHASTPAKAVVIGDPRNGEYEIYTTTNGGMVWQLVPGANIPDPLSGEFGFNNIGDAYANTVWFGTSAGRIYRSQNSGASWEVFNTPLSVAGLISFADENRGLMTGGDFTLHPHSTIYRTSDGGATWTDITTTDNAYRIQGIEYVPNSPFIVMTVTRGNILTGPFETWLSSDDGGDWTQISQGENVNWIMFINNAVGWAGEPQPVSHKTRVWKYGGGPLVGLFHPGALQAEVTLSPNPTAGSLHVEIQAETPAREYWLLLNDAQGRLIQRLEVPGTETQHTMDMKGLPAGVYTLTISSAGGSVSRPVIKQ